MKLSDQEWKLFQTVVSLPTAPFAEFAVLDFVRNWAGENGIAFSQDKSGILLEYKGVGRQAGVPWVLQGAADHPGFAYTGGKGRKAQAVFMGGVALEYFKGARVVFYPAGQPEVKAVVTSVKKDEETGYIDCSLLLDEAVDMPEGTLGMWDVTIWDKTGDNISLRVADDLAAVASILIAVMRLKQAQAKQRTLALLTRAEEVGFVGSIAVAKSGMLSPAWPILGIEASKAQTNTPVGSGMVVRIGDKVTIFDAELSMILRQTAEDLQQKYPSEFRYNVSVMPGGSTESTMLALLGYRTCAVCLPLGNYHNMAQAAIASETISACDVNSLVSFLVDISQVSSKNSHLKLLKNRLLRNYRERRVKL